MEREPRTFVLSHTLYISKKFSRGARNHKQEWPSFFLPSHLPRTHWKETFRCTHLLCPHTWLHISWELTGAAGTIWIFVSLLLSATDCAGISYRDQTMTEPKEPLRCYDWEPALLEDALSKSRFSKTRLIPCHDQGQRPSNKHRSQMVEYVNREEERNVDGNGQNKQETETQPQWMQNMSVCIMFQTNIAHSLLVSQLWLPDLRTSACCSDTPTLSEKFPLCLDSKSYPH